MLDPAQILWILYITIILKPLLSPVNDSIHCGEERKSNLNTYLKNKQTYNQNFNDVIKEKSLLDILRAIIKMLQLPFPPIHPSY